jgi:hypothetical protein
MAYLLKMLGFVKQIGSQPDGHWILQVRPANLQGLVELPCLYSKGLIQIVQCRKKVFLDAFQRRDVDRARNDVVGL